MTESGVDVPHSAAITVELLKGGTHVQLYDPAGNAVLVEPHTVEYWLGQGFVRSPLEMRGPGTELYGYLDAAGKAVEAWLQPGNDLADAESVRVSMRLVEQAWGRLSRALDQLEHLPPESEHVLMRRGEAVEPVDPGQVQLYTEQGWAVVEDAA